MRRLRFNIANLLGVILVLGVGFAALRESSDLWKSGVFTLMLAALLISILLAVHRTESKRAFWIGFALFGWIYLGLSLVPSIEPRLITTKAFTYLDSKLADRSVGAFSVRSSATNSGIPSNQVQTVAFTPDGNQFATSSQGVVRFWDVRTGKLLGGWIGTTENSVRIGHSLLALIAALMGGLLSSHLYAKNRERASGLPSPETRLEPTGHPGDNPLEQAVHQDRDRIHSPPGHL
jgi:hypothetical protein